MLSRLTFLFFLASVLPSAAALPSDPWHRAFSPRTATVLEMAQKEMPLPVIAVATRPLSDGKREFIVKMSTSGLRWAKEPVLTVSFEIVDETVSIEQALRDASAFTREFISAAQNDPTHKEVNWEPIEDLASQTRITDTPNAD